MAKIVMEEQPEFTTLPADSILLLKVDDLKVSEQDGKFGPWQKLEVKFKVLDIQATGDGSPKGDYDDLIGGPIWGSVPFRLTDNPENKLRLWTEAILGVETGVGFELDTDYFLGRECRGVTTTYNKRTTNPKTGQPFKGHQVDSLLPKAGGGASPAVQQGAAADPWASQPQQSQPQPAAQPAQPQQSFATAGGNSWDDEPPF